MFFCGTPSSADGGGPDLITLPINGEILNSAVLIGPNVNAGLSFPIIASEVIAIEIFAFEGLEGMSALLVDGIPPDPSMGKMSGCSFGGVDYLNWWTIGQ